MAYAARLILTKSNDEIRLVAPMVGFLFLVTMIAWLATSGIDDILAWIAG